MRLPHAYFTLRQTLRCRSSTPPPPAVLAVIPVNVAVYLGSCLSAQCSQELLRLPFDGDRVSLGDAVETPAAAKTDRAKHLLSAICTDKLGCLLFADVIIPSGERFPGMISGHKCYESLHVPASCSFAVSTSKRFVRLFRKDREHGAHRSGVAQSVESRYFRACVFLQVLIAVIHG